MRIDIPVSRRREAPFTCAPHHRPWRPEKKQFNWFWLGVAALVIMLLILASCNDISPTQMREKIADCDKRHMSYAVVSLPNHKHDIMCYPSDSAQE